MTPDPLSPDRSTIMYVKGEGCPAALRIRLVSTPSAMSSLEQRTVMEVQHSVPIILCVLISCVIFLVLVSATICQYAHVIELKPKAEGTAMDSTHVIDMICTSCLLAHTSVIIKSMRYKCSHVIIPSPSPSPPICVRLANKNNRIELILCFMTLLITYL